MIPKYRCVRDFARDKQGEEFKQCSLRVRGRRAFDLVPGQDDEVGSFVVEGPLHKGEGQGIGGTGFAGRAVGVDRVAAGSRASREVQVGELENFEFAVFADARGLKILGSLGRAGVEA